MKFYILYSPGLEKQISKLKEVYQNKEIKTFSDFENYIDYSTNLDFYSDNLPFPTIVIFEKGKETKTYNGADFQIKLV